jgi:uncharacterized membrane protein YbaN (DUF454 family)
MTSDVAFCKPLLHRPRRIVYVALGCVFVGLGVIGAVLPVMPTTPFLLVASYFFARSSPRLNNWLLRSPLFGPLLRDWDQHRGVRRPVKVVALAIMLTAVAATVIWGNLNWPIVLLLLFLATIGLVVVLKLPVLQNAAHQ